MAVCAFCDQEMNTAKSCKVEALHRGGVPLALKQFGKEFGGSRKATMCGDCGVARGGYHHPGCDLQPCPSCGDQLLSCGCRFDEDFDAGDGDGFDINDISEPLGVDGNGHPTERAVLNGVEVIIHRANYPDSDITTVNGIRCTTALRTLIDVAVDLSDGDLRCAFNDSLDRGLFTLADARQRLAELDMVDYKGAALVRRLLPSAD